MLRLLLLIGCLLATVASAQPQDRVIIIGTVSGLLETDDASSVPLFSEYLTRQIPGRSFTVIPYPSIDDLVAAIDGGRVDFALITPVAYVRASMRHELRTLATVMQETGGHVYPWLASAVFVRAESTALQSLADARGRKVIALSPVALGGWLGAMREWQALGMQQGDLGSVSFEYSYDAVLRGVCGGMQEIGVLPASIFARLRGRCGLRVLPPPPSTDSARFPVEISSRIYPDVAFVEVGIEDERLVNQLTTALLALEQGSPAARAINVAGFTAPLRYDTVEELMRELRVAPFNDVEQQTLREFLQNNRGKLSVLMFLLAGVLVIAYISNLLLKRKVRESEFLREQIFSNSLLAVAIIDTLSLGIVDANPAAVRLLGYKRSDDLKGKTPLQLAVAGEAGADRVTASLADMRRELQGALKPLVFEWQLQRPDGGVWDAEGHLVPFRWGSRTYILLTLVDVTEHKRILREQERMEQRLQHAERLESIGRFSGAIAHDFNNLLTVINGYSELLTLNASPDDRQLPVFREISQACARAGELTNQLLTFSRRRMAKMEALDVNRLIADSSSLLQRLLGETVTLRTVLCREPAVTLADAGQLHQVLLNFAANARDAMPEGGEFLVTTTLRRLDSAEARQLNVEEGDYLKLQVSDTGIGMTTDVQSKIFEPFFSTKGERGTGFGLATAYGIVRQSHGSIAFESTPGHGTTFTVYLPLTNMAPTPDALPASRGLDPDLGPLTVLLVEDEREVRSFASMVLQAAGCHVLEAESGAQALALVRKGGQRIDLVFTDVVLGDISGIKLAVQLHPLLPDTAILLTSGYANDEQSLGDLPQAHAGFIAKPYSPATLLARIRTLSGPRRHRA